MRKRDRILRIDPKTGKVTERGVDHGGKASVVARTKSAIVIKWPRHMSWGGIACDRVYEPAYTEVFTIESTSTDSGGYEWLTVQHVIEWANTRKPAS